MTTLIDSTGAFRSRGDMKILLRVGMRKCQATRTSIAAKRDNIVWSAQMMARTVRRPRASRKGRGGPLADAAVKETVAKCTAIIDSVLLVEQLFVMALGCVECTVPATGLDEVNALWDSILKRDSSVSNAGSNGNNMCKSMVKLVRKHALADAAAAKLLAAEPDAHMGGNVAKPKKAVWQCSNMGRKSRAAASANPL